MQTYTYALVRSGHGYPLFLWKKEVHINTPCNGYIPERNIVMSGAATFLSREDRPRRSGKATPFENVQEGQVVTAPYLTFDVGTTMTVRQYRWATLDVDTQQFYVGSIVLVNREDVTVNIKFFDGDVSVHVPMKVVLRSEFDDDCASALAKETRDKKEADMHWNKGKKEVKVSAVKGVPWKHTGS